MRFHLLAIAVALAAVPPASGQTTAPVLSPSAAINMDLAATDAIRSTLGADADEGHIAMLLALGHQQAVAATCPGFAIDPRAFSNEFDLIYDDAQGKPRVLDANQKTALERKATFAFGTAFGAQIAIAANDHGAFCEAASQERTGGKVAHLIWAK